MRTIDVKYVDTTKYMVRVQYDDVQGDSPNDWRNFQVKIFNSSYRGDLENCKKEEFYDDNDHLLIGMRSKLRAGTAWPVTVKHYSSSDGGFYTLADSADDCDGFILFEPAYVKGVSVADRRKYAISDLKTYQQWANNEVYYAEITTESGRQVDSCSGLYGDDGLKSFINETIGDAEHKTFMVGAGTGDKLLELNI